MTMKHTHTPWASTENSSCHTTIHAGDVKIASLDIQAEADEDNQAELEECMAANAAFIVRACNSHEQLVEALRDLLDEYERTINSAYCQVCADHDVVNSANAALAAAGAQP